MAIGLGVNAAVLLVCLATAVMAARSRSGPGRSGALAIVTSAVVVAASPLVVAVNRSLAPVHQGDRDMSGAWSWALVVIAAGAAAIAVYVRSTGRDTLSVDELRHSTGATGAEIVRNGVSS